MMAEHTVIPSVGAFGSFRCYEEISLYTLKKGDGWYTMSWTYPLPASSQPHSIHAFNIVSTARKIFRGNRDEAWWTQAAFPWVRQRYLKASSQGVIQICSLHDQNAAAVKDFSCGSCLRGILVGLKGANEISERFRSLFQFVHLKTFQSMATRSCSFETEDSHRSGHSNFAMQEEDHTVTVSLLFPVNRESSFC